MKPINPKQSLKHLKTVTLLGQTLEVKHRKPHKEHHGQCDIEKRTIELNNSLKGEFALRVLIHELVHGGLRLAGVDYQILEPVEEQICTIMESVIPDIIDIVMENGLYGEDNQ
ncbi:MAG: hypothetical protein GY920_20145 [Aliivibrio sp.]|nr:hypothetical protein [Aliivibrio sp.]